MTDDLIRRTTGVQDRVLGWMQAQDFTGADPFDGLESRWFQMSGLGRWRETRLVWLQILKHAPGWMRHAAHIPLACNPKTLALMSGAADGVALCAVGDRLLSLQNPDGGWGYPFAWQARAFYAGRTQSNAIVTAFAVDGLIANGLARHDPAMKRAADFMIRDLWRHGYFAYLGDDDTEIHNASLWTAWALHQIRPGHEVSHRAVARVVAAQQADGSWSYGTRPHHRFVDGFHTGYLLDLLDRFRKAGMADLDTPIARGLDFYRAQCFNAHGLPRTFAGRAGYIDTHAVAQAIGTLQRFGFDGPARHVMAFALDRLFDDDRGLFYAGLGYLGPDRRVFMRWTQGWMVWALSIMIRAAQQQADK
ncbi:hypothetical protein [Thalassospira sp.]|uniref:hypothetical protein n=1 Tax=Thalassospira sp. TaxID=1912094 RepID=UPI002733A6E9|nr:hypothetical protein [Thalassospira sp.]MDP2698721.1 hypothetical protein [Thalassospira sp.]